MNLRCSKNQKFIVFTCKNMKKADFNQHLESAAPKPRSKDTTNMHPITTINIHLAKSNCC